MSRLITRGFLIVVLGLLLVGFFSCQRAEKSTGGEIRREKQAEEVEKVVPKTTPQEKKVSQPKKATETPSRRSSSKEVLSSKEAPSKKALPERVKISEQFQALITFLSGEVYVSRDSGEWKEAVIGESLKQGDSLRVDEDSYCEVQFGNTATIRIQQNTEVRLKDILLQMRLTKVKVALTAGAVLCKVRKLSKNDRFKIQTPSVICGVRGTQFVVRFSRSKGTVVAVKRGRVAVLPAVLDVDAIKEKLKTKPKELLAVLEKVEDAAPVVTANRELRVNTAVIKKTEGVFKTVVDKITSVAVAERAIAPKKIKEITRLVNETVRRVKENISPPVTISKESLEELKPVEEMKIIEMPLPEKQTVPQSTPKKPSGGVSEKASGGGAFNLERIGIIAEPKDAEIFLNGNPVGKGTFFGLFRLDEQLDFVIKRDGFVTKELKINVTKGSGREYHIRLSEEKKTIKINVNPPDARIFIDGNLVGRGSYSSAFVIGRRLSLEVRKEGYIPKKLTIEVKKGGKREYSIAIKPRVIPFSFSVSTTALVGRVAVFKDLIIAADTAGMLYAVDTQGKVVWKIPTKNTPNVNSFPICIGNKVFFSGSTEFIVVDVSTGKIDYREKLSESSSHMFGRHVVAYDDNFLFPTDNGVRVRKFDGRIVKEIKIPGGTKMSPAIYKNSLLVVNQRGVFYRIDLTTGRIIAKLPTRAVQPVAVTVLVHGNKAFFSGRKGRVVCIDLTKDRVLWQKKPTAVKSLGVFHDLEYGRNEIFMFARSYIYAFRATDGRILFSPIKAVSAPPLYYKGYLYTGKSNGNFVVISATTGRIVKSLKLGEIITTRPRIMDGKIIVGTKGGKIVAINPEGVE